MQYIRGVDRTQAVLFPQSLDEVIDQSINYIRSIYRHINVKVGIGYYNLGINKIRQTTPFRIIATGRNINYRHPLGIFLLFATEKYHYDNLSLTFGVNYEERISKRLNIATGGDLNYFYTISQLYHISSDNIRYRTNEGRTLGFCVSSYVGLLQNVNAKFYISPKIVVPLYQQLHGDRAFGEDQSLRMEKWFNGVGLSIGFGKYL